MSAFKLAVAYVRLLGVFVVVSAAPLCISMVKKLTKRRDIKDE